MIATRRCLRTFLPFSADLVPWSAVLTSAWTGSGLQKRHLAKGSTKTKKSSKSSGTKQKKTQKTKKFQPAPKFTDSKIEQKMQRCFRLFETPPPSQPTSKPRSRPASPMTKKELAYAKEKAKEYSRQKMRQHRQWQADMTMKERIARDAIMALPLDLREEAVKEDTTPIPMRLPFQTDSPPREWL